MRCLMPGTIVLFAHHLQLAESFLADGFACHVRFSRFSLVLMMVVMYKIILIGAYVSQRGTQYCIVNIMCNFLVCCTVFSPRYFAHYSVIV